MKTRTTSGQGIRYGSQCPIASVVGLGTGGLGQGNPRKVMGFVSGLVRKERSSFGTGLDGARVTRAMVDKILKRGRRLSATKTDQINSRAQTFLKRAWGSEEGIAYNLRQGADVRRGIVSEH